MKLMYAMETVPPLVSVKVTVRDLPSPEGVIAIGRLNGETLIMIQAGATAEAIFAAIETSQLTAEERRLYWLGLGVPPGDPHHHYPRGRRARQEDVPPPLAA
ncbi:hypothetical protein GCM10027294_25280 [Marinactinospora endophytica]